MKNATAPPKTAKKTSTPKSHSSWVARVNAGLKLRAGAEKEIAAALRERLDKVGEKKWLAECEAEWGWSRTTCYRHLNPKLMAAARAHTCEARSKVGTSLVISDPAGCACSRRSAGDPHDAGCTSTSAKKMAETLARNRCACDLTKVVGPEAGFHHTGLTLGGHRCPKYTPPPTPVRELTAAEVKQAAEREQRVAEARVAMVDSPGYHEDRLTQTILNKLRDAIDQIVAEREHLTNRLIERLDEQWNRLGTVIEQYGDEGGGLGKELVRREREEMEVAS